MVKAVPAGGLLILDLESDERPIWSQTSSYYNTTFIWNMLHNFGGRTGMYGQLDTIATLPASALATNATTGVLMGIGLTPEAIESNPVVYDLMMENTWRGLEGVQDLDAWIEQYVSRRYAGALPSPIFQAWAIMQNTVYNCNVSQQGTSGSVFAAPPAFNITKVSCCAPSAPYYNTAELQAALLFMLEAGNMAGEQLTQQETYQYDIVMLTSQVMSNLGYNLMTNFSHAYTSKNLHAFNATSVVFLELIADMDTLMGTKELFLFGAWIANATRWATNTSVTEDGTCDGSGTRINCAPSGVTADTCEELNCCWNSTTLNVPWCFYNNLTDYQILMLNARTQVG